MDTAASAVLNSWTFDPGVAIALGAAAVLYIRGWVRGRRASRGEHDLRRLTCFLGGLAVLFLALESPLDALDALFLSAHMAQHLLLMMIAPPLLLLARPAIPLLRGLPRSFVKEGLGPFLAWPELNRGLSWLAWPPAAWLAFAVSTIAWHLPALYERALVSPFWHGAQHACFFWTGVLFWQPVIAQSGRRAPWPRWALIPYLLLGDILNTALSAFLVFSDRVLYPSYIGVNGLSAKEDQAAAGAIMWVPGSIVYLVPAIAIAVRLFSGSRNIERRWPAARKTPKRWPLPVLRRIAQVGMLLLAVAVMWEGFFGTQAAALNLAGVLPWIYWRALSLFALILIGNLFCMTCPFTLARDLGRRFFPAKLRWPNLLRSKWLPASLLVVYLWAYEAYSLWDSPSRTACLIAGYFAVVLIVDGIFRGASFCKYVCPIGQFHFAVSLISPYEIRARRLDLCRTCRTHDCIRGNEHARGCELQLFVPKKSGNMDCTLCLDCIKACPQDNVALTPGSPSTSLTTDPYRSSVGRFSKRTDLAVLAAVIVFGGLVNAAGMTSPVMAWEHPWHRLFGTKLTAMATVILGVLMVPTVALLIATAVTRPVPLSTKPGDVVRRFILGLVPLGAGIWASHLLFHLATSRLVIPGWLTPAQIVLLDGGLLLTLYTYWRVSAQSTRTRRHRAALFAPWVMLASMIYGAAVWIVFQPMQMRGVVH